jgi:GNAT superfamily N-acetyltransferase
MDPVAALDPADAAVVRAAAARAGVDLALGPDAAGWVARDGGDVVGALLDVPGRRADLRPEDWFATTPAALLALWTEASAAWVDDGLLTHRVVLPAGSPLAGVLLDLGLGHQQAYGRAPVAPVGTGPGGTDVVVRRAGRADLAETLTLAPLVARHQAAAPTFAPRTAAFVDGLGEGMAEVLDDAGQAAWLARVGPDAVGLLVAEVDGTDVEVVLVVTAPAARGRGVAGALLGAAVRWGADRGATDVVADWRTTNPAAAGFWRAAGLRVVAHRWARTVDPTPT